MINFQFHSICHVLVLPPRKLRSSDRGTLGGESHRAQFGRILIVLDETRYDICARGANPRTSEPGRMHRNRPHAGTPSPHAVDLSAASRAVARALRHDAGQHDQRRMRRAAESRPARPAWQVQPDPDCTPHYSRLGYASRLLEEQPRRGLQVAVAAASASSSAGVNPSLAGLSSLSQPAVCCIQLFLSMRSW